MDFDENCATLSGTILERTSSIFGNKTKQYWYEIKNDKLIKMRGKNREIVETIDIKYFIGVTKKYTQQDHESELILTDSLSNNRVLIFNNISEIEFSKWYDVLSKIINDDKDKNYKEIIDIFESLVDPVIILDESLNIVGVNAIGKLFIGYEKNEIIDKHIRTIVDKYTAINLEINRNKSEIYNFKHSTNPKKIILKCKNGGKKQVTFSVSEYIIKSLLRKVYVIVMRYIDINLIDKSNADVDDIGMRLFDKINGHNIEQKNMIMEYFKAQYKILDSNAMKLINSESENKELNNRMNLLIKDNNELTDRITYYEENSSKATLLNVLTHDYSYNIFLEFCKELRMEENVLFWNSVHKMKEKYIMDRSNPQIVKEAVEIFDVFISYDGVYSINVSSNIRENVTTDIDNLHSIYNIFDDAVRDVITTLSLDAFYVFCESIVGKRVVSLLKKEDVPQG